MNRGALIERCLSEAPSVQAALDLAQRVAAFIDGSGEKQKARSGRFEKDAQAGHLSADAPAPSAAPPAAAGSSPKVGMLPSAPAPARKRRAAKTQPPSLGKVRKEDEAKPRSDDRVFEIIAAAGEVGVGRGKIMKATALKRASVNNALVRLRKAARIAKNGTHGHTRYLAAVPPPAASNGRTPKPKSKSAKMATPVELDAATKRIISAIAKTGATGMRSGSIPITCGVTESRSVERVRHLLSSGALREKRVGGVVFLYIADQAPTSPPPARGYANGEGSPIAEGPGRVDHLLEAEAKWSAALGSDRGVEFSRRGESERQAAAAAKG